MFSLKQTTKQSELSSQFRQCYCSDADAVLLVYDISDMNSFMALKYWLLEARQNGNPNTTIMLIGNKSDLEHHRSIDTKEGEAFAQENRLVFLGEVSAKDMLSAAKVRHHVQFVSLINLRLTLLFDSAFLLEV